MRSASLSMDGLGKSALERVNESDRTTEATVCVFLSATIVDVNISEDRRRMERS
jgi:hypothetical protein